MTDKPIEGFFGPYHFLSNFYECKVAVDGRVYSSSEAAYQSLKTTDDSARESFTLMTPLESKRAGKTIKLRKNWNKIKLFEMRKVVFAKFQQNPDLLEMLRETGSRFLVEKNYWGDRFWGADMSGVGCNHLGKCLMHVRQELCNIDDPTWDWLK
jgi:ribA/ribD-fused uncharacterized protein